jgi:hypothetical protein
VNPKCATAFLLLHLTPKSSGYIENINLKGFKVISYYNRDKRAKGSSSKCASTSVLIVKDLGVSSYI